MIFKSNHSGNNIFAHTYSIVARDPTTGEMGVGVQSHWFSVGSVVSWGEAGVGVVATQSLVNKSFGLRGLELLKQGKSPQEAVEILISDDEGKDVRQLAILDCQGRIATHTGSKCIKHAGHKIGDNFSVQANMMLSEKVWPAMAETFEKHGNLPLPERIIKSLDAAEFVGGDIRGKQSAALLIVAGEHTENRWEDPVIDLRVEDHVDPLKELNRLLKVFRAYEHMNNGDLAIEKGDMAKALEEYDAAQSMFPENPEMTYWTAVSLANQNKLEEALKLFKKVFKKDNNWRLLTERLPHSELLNLDEEDFKKIITLK
ncbi:MAG: DUF1028 domain-containing protein [Candidatus Hermodarchaeota archaeon]